MEIFERLEENPPPGWKDQSDNQKMRIIFWIWVRRIGKWKFQPLETLKVGDTFIDALKVRRKNTNQYHLNIIVEISEGIIIHKNLETGVVTTTSPEDFSDSPIVIRLLEKKGW